MLTWFDHMLNVLQRVQKQRHCATVPTSCSDLPFMPFKVMLVKQHCSLGRFR